MNIFPLDFLPCQRTEMLPALARVPVPRMPFDGIYHRLSQATPRLSAAALCPQPVSRVSPFPASFVVYFANLNCVLCHVVGRYRWALRAAIPVSRVRNLGCRPRSHPRRFLWCVVFLFGRPHVCCFFMQPIAAFKCPYIRARILYRMQHAALCLANRTLCGSRLRL